MSFSKASKALLAVAFLTPAIYAQVRPTAVAGPVSIGFKRPFAWKSSAIGSNAVVPGPGQTNCGPTSNLCYYFPQDIIKAYGLSFIANANGGQGMTVAIVDAFYNPQTEADLANYNAFAVLPACTIANSCLTIVNQNGTTNMAGIGFNAGWAQETNLDVQTVHALAPKAHILLVATNTNSDTDLGTGELYARAHANVVSNSWGGDEFAGQTTEDTLYYAGSTVPLLFSSGDAGAVLEHPCTSPFVTCVGGTHLLTSAASNRNVESAWGDGVIGDDGGGGGCSTMEPSQAYQVGFSPCGAFRGVPDIGALADPYTGFLVYLGPNAAQGAANAGIYIFGGTSLAAPLEAAVIALIDTARAAASKAPLGANLNTLLYQAAAGALFRYRYYDVTLGSTGDPAGPGWDKTNGLGVPLAPSLAAYLVSLP